MKRPAIGMITTPSPIVHVTVHVGPSTRVEGRFARVSKRNDVELVVVVAAVVRVVFADVLLVGAGVAVVELDAVLERGAAVG